MTNTASKEEAEDIIKFFQSYEMDICPWCNEPVEIGQDFGVFSKGNTAYAIIHAKCFDERTNETLL